MSRSSRRRGKTESRKAFSLPDRPSGGASASKGKMYTFPPSNSPKSSRSNRNFQSANEDGLFDEPAGRKPYTSNRVSQAMGHQASTNSGTTYSWKRDEVVRKNPTELRFNPLAYWKILFMCHAFDVEVGGFGISRSETDLLYVEQFHVIKQYSQSAHTEFDDDALANYIDDLADNKIPLEQGDRLWFHTHPVMSAQPSGTDEATFGTKFHTQPWVVMAIYSKTNDCTARLKFNNGPGIERELRWVPDWARMPELMKTINMTELEKEWRAEFYEKVTIGSAPGTTGYYGGHVQGGYSGGYQGGYKGGQGRSTYDGVKNDYRDKRFSPAAEGSRILVPTSQAPSGNVVPPSGDPSRFFERTQTGGTSTTPTTPTGINDARHVGNDDAAFAGYMGGDGYMGDDTALEPRDSVPFSPGIEDFDAMGAQYDYDFEPDSDVSTFHKFLSKYDWMADESSGRYVSKLATVPVEQRMHSAIQPLAVHAQALDELWEEVCITFMAQYSEIKLPQYVYRDGLIWREDKASAKSTQPVTSTQDPESVQCPQQPQSPVVQPVSQQQLEQGVQPAESPLSSPQSSVLPPSQLPQLHSLPQAPVPPPLATQPPLTGHQKTVKSNLHSRPTATSGKGTSSPTPD